MPWWTVINSFVHCVMIVDRFWFFWGSNVVQESGEPRETVLRAYSSTITFPIMLIYLFCYFVPRNHVPYTTYIAFRIDVDVDFSGVWSHNPNESWARVHDSEGWYRSTGMGILGAKPPSALCPTKSRHPSTRLDTILSVIVSPEPE